MVKARYDIIYFIVIFLCILMNAQSSLLGQSGVITSDKTVEGTKPEIAAEKNQWNMVQRIFKIKHVDVNDLERVLSIFGIRMETSAIMNVISVSGPKDVVDAVEAAINRLDVPPPPKKNIELTVYIIAAGEQNDSKGPMPPELAGIFGLIKKQFVNYKSLCLMDTLVMQSMEGGDSSTVGYISHPNVENIIISYNFRIGNIQVSKERKTQHIIIERMGFEASFKQGPQLEEKPKYTFPGIRLSSAGLSFPVGKPGIVGKTSLGDSRSAIILVLTARIISPGPIGAFKNIDNPDKDLLTVKFLNARLEKILNFVSEFMNKQLALDLSMDTLNEKISLDIKDVSPKDLLDKLAAISSFSYKIDGDTIVIRKH